MGYFFTFLFLTTAYITPGVIFGPLAPYHIEIILAVLAILASIPSIGSSGLLRMRQTYAVVGICFAVVFSIAATGWLGGVPQICYAFLPVAAGFFLAAVNCRKKWHLGLVVLSLFLCSVYYIVHGVIDLNHHLQISPFLYHADTPSPRLRGLGYVNDPNDFAQVMVSLIPLVFLWRTKSRIANFFILGVPIAVLIYGMYLTHSRGASIALMVVVLFGLRKKIGTIPAAVLAGVLMAAVLAAGWGGGRDINIDSGEGRLDAWSAGIQYIKHRPLTGIGYDQFADSYGITAHNSVIICAAEIGVPGFFFWVFFLLVSFRVNVQLGNIQPDGVRPQDDDKERALGNGVASPFDLWATKRIAAPSGALQVAGAPGVANSALMRSSPVALSSSPRWSPAGAVADPSLPAAFSLPPEELRRIAQLMVVSMAGFLTAGWFLSRALSIWLFMYCGMSCAVLRMAERNGIFISRDPMGRLARWTGGIAVILILIIYVLLRVHNVVG